MATFARRLRSHASKTALALVVLMLLPAAITAHADPYAAVLVPGSQWAGAFAEGADLNVYSNGNGAQDTPGPFGPRYECTELATRWAHYRYGATAMWNISRAADMWDAGPRMNVPFLQNPNGGAAAPQFGDIMVFGATASNWTGHVAVVSATTATTVTIVEQNASNHGTDTLPIDGTYMPPRWGLTIVGWLRASPPTSLGGGPVPAVVHSVSTQRGQSELFWRGTDNGLWHMWNGGDGWSGASRLPSGEMASEPHPVSWGDGRVDVFWKGADGALWHSFYAPGRGWAVAESLGGSPLGSDPEPVTWGPGHLDVFWKGKDNGLWHSYFWNGVWTTTQSLSEAGLGSSPHVLSAGPGHIDVFWKGVDAALWHKEFAWGWTPAVSLGDGPLGSEPHPVSWGAGNLDVFWRGTDGSVWHAYQAAGGWVGPQSLGGFITSDPLPSSPAIGVLKVYAVGRDSQLRQFSYRGGWFAPITIGDGPIPSELAGGQRLGGGREGLYWVGTDHAVWSTSF